MEKKREKMETKPAGKRTKRLGLKLVVVSVCWGLSLGSFFSERLAEPGHTLAKIGVTVIVAVAVILLFRPEINYMKRAEEKERADA
ncbi:MAG: hypothetical protein LBI96_02580 [Odoribacteraceae bacterium]|jgi:hypothetical protein|nr:hypothetical protein [Odoribacteraceae bacterium]